ncbi:MAG: phosphatase PAP2 family protein [Chloroflexi bacterium]|nr:phosphatase PAP2 family protein [Chloroflexota bacterium]
MRRAPDPTSRSVAAAEAPDLGSAVPSPAFAFLLSLIALPSLFWLVAFKRTTGHTVPEDWLMVEVVPPIQHWVMTNAPPLDALLVGISGLGSGWFVGLGFGIAGLVALARGRTDLALLLAAGTLAFPIEWALKYFTYFPEPGHAPLGLLQLWNALFDIGGRGLDDIADFPAGHALRATVFYGLLAFCVARVSRDRRRGMIAYGVAIGLIAAISLIRLYLGAHYPIDLLGGWMAGGALLAVIVAVYSLAIDYPAPA